MLNGVDEAYVTAVSNRGLRVTLGELRQRWGSGYRGDLLLSDNAPARPTLQVELPFSLGHRLGDYRFTQFLSRYRNGGQTIYGGAGGWNTRSATGRRCPWKKSTRPPSSAMPPCRSCRITPTRSCISATTRAVRLQLQLQSRRHGHPARAGHGAACLRPVLHRRPPGPEGPGQGNKTPRKIGYLLGYADAFARSGTDVVLEYRPHRTARLTPSCRRCRPAWLRSGPICRSAILSAPMATRSSCGWASGWPRAWTSPSRAATAAARPPTSPPSAPPRWIWPWPTISARPSRSACAYSEYREDPYPGAVLPAGSGTGGADYGETLRRHISAAFQLPAGVANRRGLANC